MDILKFLADANLAMAQISEATTKIVTLGTAVASVVESGKRLLTVWIRRRSEADSEPDSTPQPDAASSTSGQGVAEVAEMTSVKPDVAVLVDINRRMLMDVGEFLAGKGLDADVFIVTNDLAYGEKPQFLNPENPADWDEIVKEFNTALSKIKRVARRARLHIFLSTPLPLALALGCVMGTVDEGTVLYHWEKGTYWPVLTVSRDWRR